MNQRSRHIYLASVHILSFSVLLQKRLMKLELEIQ